MAFVQQSNQSLKDDLKKVEDKMLKLQVEIASLTNSFKCEQKKNSEYNKFQLEVNNELNAFKSDIKL